LGLLWIFFFFIFVWQIVMNLIWTKGENCVIA